MNSRVSGADAQLNNTAAAAAESAGSADVFTVGDALNLGLRARIRVLENGLAIDVKDGSGNWQEQNAWTES